MSSTARGEFLQRARVEADRYGPDPWVFVRELLQNARDAGATRVDIVVEHVEGRTRLRCRDDGEGMSFSHAKRYLFSLYASSKETSSNQVGRFGVGFWSILRFAPTRIVVRSHPRDEEAWEVTLDGDLERADRTTPKMGPGTEIVLERVAYDDEDLRRVKDAAVQNGRFLCQRDDRGAPLPVRVNGELINQSFTLPAPSSAFSRGGLRGVVALGDAPRVELFARGLRVRSAAALDDLLSSRGHTDRTRVRFPELPGSVAPQALLESDHLELMLSRADARDDRALRKLVDLANAELRRLVDRQLDALRPPRLHERLFALVRSIRRAPPAVRTLGGALTGATLAGVIAFSIWPDQIMAQLRPAPALLPVVPIVAGPPGPGPTNVAAPPSQPRGYADLAATYRGPSVAELSTLYSPAVPLRYRPEKREPYFAAMVMSSVAAGSGGAPILDEAYPNTACKSECIEVELPIDATAGPLRIPVPTGHRLDTSSVRLDQARPRVVRSGADEPAIVLRRPWKGVLRYQTGPAKAPRPAVSAALERSHGLPDDLRKQARALAKLPFAERIDTAIAITRARVTYDTSETIVTRHANAIASGQAFIERALEIGAGDCDVQNGLLVELLHEAKVPARLAVGYVGIDGRVSPLLHAWVEVRAEDGRWRVADATSRTITLGGSPRVASADAPFVASEGPQTNPANTTGPGPEGATSTPPVDTAPPASEGVARAPGATQGPTWLAAVPQEAGWILLGLAALGLVGSGLRLRRRTRREVAVDQGGQLAPILAGALRQPAAFRHLPSLFDRELVPTCGSSRISLRRARELAEAGRLFAGRGDESLSRQSVARGVPVLDLAEQEGQVVAAALGATDLRRWSALLDAATRTEILDALSDYLRRRGDRWQLRVAPRLHEGVAALDLRPLGLSGRETERIVLVDAANPWLQEARHMVMERPAAATFGLLDHLLDQLDLPPDRRATLLAEAARAALMEVGR